MWVIKSRDVQAVVFVLAFIIGTALLLRAYAPMLLDSFSTEMGATMFGILLGFTINRVIIDMQKRKTSNQILEKIYYELMQNNKSLATIKIADFKDIFTLFKTTSWEMFNSRLELDNIEILYELVDIYHRFEMFNTAMKSPEPNKEIMKMLKLYPDFYVKLEKDIDMTLILMEAQ